MSKIDYYKSFCTGCGLCKSVSGADLHLNDKGFFEPQITEITFQENYCPVNGGASLGKYADSIWGPVEDIGLGWSTDSAIRVKASSGGVLTAIACWFLNTGRADGVLQTKVKSNNPLQTEMVCSTNEMDVVTCSGSRYAESSPLADIIHYLKQNKRYVFIGKPCDVQILKSFVNDRADLPGKIVFWGSFFCAGVPSYSANKELVKKMGSSLENLISFEYRGNGWPGFATAIECDGKQYQMDYDSSWGRVLGRDKRKFCRLCVDGIGLFADIACGDAWYMTDDKKPDFSERLGRNVIIPRTQYGKEILANLIRDNAIAYKSTPEFIENLQYIQKYQFERRSTYLAQWLALKITFHETPKMNLKNMYKLSKNVSFARQIDIFWGTLKRIYRGRYK